MTIGHTIFGKGSEGVIVLHGWLSDHSVFEPMFPSLNTDTFTHNLQQLVSTAGQRLVKQ